MTIEEAVNSLTPEELELLNSDSELLAQFKAKYGEEKTSLISKAWEALAVPEQMSREGLSQIAGLFPTVEPTGNMARDIAFNTPRILAESVAETAPGFISRGSLATAGALKGLPLLSKPVSAVGRYLGKTAESTSGLGYNTPGVLRETVRDPGLLFGQGTEKAGKAYKSLKDVGKIRESMKLPSIEGGIPNHQNIIKQAWGALKDGTLTEDEALIARQSVDALKGKIPQETFNATRTVFDKIAKRKFSEADKAYERAIKSEALRQFWGINKSGTPSIVKGGILAGAGLVRGAAQIALAPILSPVAQGIIASGLGATRKAAFPFLKNPRTGFLSEPLLERFR